MSNEKATVVDHAMADILRNKTEAERLEIASGMWRSARTILWYVLKSKHNGWSDEQIQGEVARRLSHGYEALSMNMHEYLRNRHAFPLDELAKHRGEWVAWSPDGRRLVATSHDPAALDDLVCSAGENPENCLVEGIPDSDCVIGGSFAHSLIRTIPECIRCDFST